MQVIIFTVSYPYELLAVLSRSAKRGARMAILPSDLYMPHCYGVTEILQSSCLNWNTHLNTQKSRQVCSWLMPCFFFIIFIVFLGLRRQLHDVFHTDLSFCTHKKPSETVGKTGHVVSWAEKNVTSTRTFVFRKLADKLLDALFPYGVLEISCRRCYFLRSHFAIMIPANEVQTISPCWQNMLQVQPNILVYNRIFPRSILIVGKTDVSRRATTNMDRREYYILHWISIFLYHVT